MRLPEKNELDNEDERYLYNLDKLEHEQFSSLRRINSIMGLVKKYSFGKKILDLGSAQGDIATLLAEMGFETIALDLNPNFLKYAKKKREFGKISYVCGNALDVPFDNNAFDAVIAGELLEHVAYPERLLEEARRVLKKEGLLVITTPNNHRFLGLFSGIKPRLFSSLRKKDRKALSERQFGPAGEDHLFVFDKLSLKRLIEKQGFQIINERYVNSFLINKMTYGLLRFFPKFILAFLDDFFIRNFLLQNKSSICLIIAARKK